MMYFTYQYQTDKHIGYGNGTMREAPRSMDDIDRICRVVAEQKGLDPSRIIVLYWKEFPRRPSHRARPGYFKGRFA